MQHVNDETTHIIFETDDGQPFSIDLKQSRADLEKFEPNARLEVLAWAQLKATREQAAALEKLAAAVTQFALAGHDQAEAVREQTAQMQHNIDDATEKAPKVEDVFRMVTERLPEVMERLGKATANNPDLRQTLFGDPVVSRGNSGAG